MSTEPETIPALPASKNKVYLAESQCPHCPLTKAIVLINDFMQLLTTLGNPEFSET